MAPGFRLLLDALGWLLLTRRQTRALRHDPRFPLVGIPVHPGWVGDRRKTGGQAWLAVGEDRSVPGSSPSAPVRINFKIHPTPRSEIRRENTQLLPAPPVSRRSLRQTLQPLNPNTTEVGVLHAAREIIRLRQDMDRVAANRELLALLIDGVTVDVPNEKGEPKAQTVHVIDWKILANNDFPLATQVWFVGNLGEKRADAVGFINGIPLLFLEFKAPTTPVRHAYDHNLRNYRGTTPQVFVPTGFAMVSNGDETRLGPVDAPWDYWAEWNGWTRTTPRQRPGTSPARHLRTGGLPRHHQELPGVTVREAEIRRGAAGQEGAAQPPGAGRQPRGTGGARPSGQLWSTRRVPAHSKLRQVAVHAGLRAESVPQAGRQQDLRRHHRPHRPRHPDRRNLRRMRRAAAMAIRRGFIDPRPHGLWRCRHGWERRLGT